jgi:hypothetical protein
MQRKTKDLQNLAIGNVKDPFFDGEAWTLRHLVVEAGSRLPSRKELISRQHGAGSLDGYR